MIKTDEFGGVTVGGMLDRLLAEYENAGKGIIRGAISAGYDESTLRAMFGLCFIRVMDLLEEEEQ